MRITPKLPFLRGFWDIINNTLCYNIKRYLSYGGTDKEPFKERRFAMKKQKKRQGINSYALVRILREEDDIRKWIDEIETEKELKRLGYSKEEKSSSEEWYELGRSEGWLSCPYL